MSTRRRYRLRPRALGLPVWGWSVAGAAVMLGLIGVGLAVASVGSWGAVLMGIAGMALSMCVLVGMATDERRIDRSS